MALKPSMLAVRFGLEPREHQGLAHRIGAAKNDSERHPWQCLLARLGEPPPAQLSLVVHIPYNEDGFHAGRRIPLPYRAGDV
jgi:hypothetical protein